MEDFMLIVNGDDSKASPEQMQNTMVKYQAWMTKWKDQNKYLEGSPFKPEGRHLKIDSEVSEQGDFLNPETRVCGFIWIKAESIDEATLIAQECPLLENLEIVVRPFLKMA